VVGEGHLSDPVLCSRLLLKSFYKDFHFGTRA
jgi:hypothetical protein